MNLVILQSYTKVVLVIYVTKTWEIEITLIYVNIDPYYYVPYLLR